MAVIVPSLGLAYVPVPKNACSSLKIACYEINEGRPYAPQRQPDGAMLHIHGFAGYGSEPMTQDSLDATAFLARLAVVRDPVRRVISCYKNRVQHFRELSTRHVLTETFEATGLLPNPSFDLFVERLEDYRSISWSIRHHSDLQRVFLGDDRGAYAHVFRMDELPVLEAWLCQRVGREIRFQHLQRGGAEFPDPEISPATRRRLLEYCAPDLGLWWEG